MKLLGTSKNLYNAVVLCVDRLNIQTCSLHVCGLITLVVQIMVKNKIYRDVFKHRFR